MLLYIVWFTCSVNVEPGDSRPELNNPSGVPVVPSPLVTVCSRTPLFVHTIVANSPDVVLGAPTTIASGLNASSTILTVVIGPLAIDGAADTKAKPVYRNITNKTVAVIAVIFVFVFRLIHSLWD